MLKTIEAALAALSIPATPEGLYAPIRYALEGGGKRIRPVLTLTAYSLYRDDVAAALPAATALEIYHNHTLLHDDLMDNADMRRGRPTVHRKWDANTAILSGDTMLILAFRELLRLSPTHTRPALELLSRSMQEVCEGQQHDMDFERREDVTEGEYIAMIRQKTSVLLACALQLGALVADAPVADQLLLYRFGEKLGLAFQLQDDYLDCYGDPAVFGKALGGDIRSGKKTFMLINAMQRADAAQRYALRSHDVPAVLGVYAALGIPALCQERIDGLFSEARALYDSLPVAGSRKRALWEIAEQMMGRKK